MPPKGGISSVRRSTGGIKRPLPGQVPWRRNDKRTWFRRRRMMSWDRAPLQGCIRQELQITRQRKQWNRELQQIRVTIQKGYVVNKEAIQRRCSFPWIRWRTQERQLALREWRCHRRSRREVVQHIRRVLINLKYIKCHGRTDLLIPAGRYPRRRDGQKYFWHSPRRKTRWQLHPLEKHW